MFNVAEDNVAFCEDEFTFLFNNPPKSFQKASRFPVSPGTSINATRVELVQDDFGCGIACVALNLTKLTDDGCVGMYNNPRLHLFL